ncbi:TPA: phosphate butyryltransferase [Staphylococcus pseudintermedius]|uniref:phosphate acyltransferase n=1 Tax=Staphylococcus pseudintermedius TaxID=283734 RepID=UPI001036C88F|nr:phosphate acyltransferase [Staphylococcus pseudintermedius]EGQ3272507.1 phosphate butyryltransferase [Staphylococcus pseudintermedius]EGQ3382795.1 phosphate butyryltransferase [Staphylococcus pseudintermedius]EGQ3561710.1 phosphate butyryltransferase [Staphylococcus pseudintermedius]EGQ3672822.1 phosphate butyryltransferase [Staphylococcus pseudintermedius]EGQ3804123.1 phosphate butyryltransferase [Staphylococcus pseudintermedius]
MNFTDLLKEPQALTGTIAIVNATDEPLIRVIIEVLKQTEADFKLYNNQDVAEIIRSFDLSADFLKRIHIQTFDTKEAAIEGCLNDLYHGKAQILMKGQISTAKILSAVLKRNAQGTKPFLNHVALCEIPSYHKLLMISDVALNIAPTEEEMKAIIQNLVDFSKRLQYQQLHIALLSSVEKVSPKIPSTVQAERLSEYYQSHPIEPHVHVEGPFALDNAIDKKSAIQKGIHSKVAGNADVLIVPGLDAGNVLYKSLTYFGRAKVASLILGAHFPIVLTSRADSIENKINSILVALKVG